MELTQIGTKLSYTTLKVTPTEMPSTSPTLSDVRNFDSGTQGGTSWTGALIGVNDHYNNNPSHLPTIVMLESDDGAYWFIGFNHYHVTITKWQSGVHSLRGILVEGQSETIGNWRDSGIDLKVLVHEINTNASPHFADIEIIFGLQRRILRGSI